jgi:UDP-glucose 4-epimerase
MFLQNILLLGGSGFIGKNIIEYVESNKNINLYVCVRNKDNTFCDKEYFENIRYIHYSHFDDIVIIDIINQYDINCIIHLISSLKPSSCEMLFYESFNTFILPTFKLLDFVADRNIKFVYFSSGGAVYGNYNEPITEQFDRNPINFYGFSKLLVENYIFFKSKTSNLDYIILRPSNAYGKYQNFKSDQGFIAVAIDKIVNKNKIQVWGSGNVLRDYIYVSDIVEILFILLERNVSRNQFNISSGQLFSVNDIINTIEKELNINAIVEYNKERKIDAPKIELLNDKIKSIFPFNFININDGIKKQLEFYKSINES